MEVGAFSLIYLPAKTGLGIPLLQLIFLYINAGFVCFCAASDRQIFLQILSVHRSALLLGANRHGWLNWQNRAIQSSPDSIDICNGIGDLGGLFQFSPELAVLIGLVALFDEQLKQRHWIVCATLAVIPVSYYPALFLFAFAPIYVFTFQKALLLALKDALPGVHQAYLEELKVGNRTKPIVDKTMRLGPILIVGRDRNACQETVRQIQETLILEVETSAGTRGIEW